VSDSARITPTAHYTGWVWARNGLSHPRLQSAEGRVLYEVVRPYMLASRAWGGPQLEPYLLARHAAIDVLLERAIEDHGISQVLEVACGLSPRGWRFASRYGERITYVEADLPEMADRKRTALEEMGSLGQHHRVRALDALKEDGPESVSAVVDELDPAGGLVIITEGLLNYLPHEPMLGLWRRFALAAGRFRSGRYISDIHLGSVQGTQVRAARTVLAAFVRGSVHLHFADADSCLAALRQAGFERAELHRPSSLAPERRGAGAGLAHVLEAATG